MFIGNIVLALRIGPSLSAVPGHLNRRPGQDVPARLSYRAPVVLLRPNISTVEILQLGYFLTVTVEIIGSSVYGPCLLLDSA